jgi:hypothetical protein
MATVFSGSLRQPRLRFNVTTQQRLSALVQYFSMAVWEGKGCVQRPHFFLGSSWYCRGALMVRPFSGPCAKQELHEPGLPFLLYEKALRWWADGCTWRRDETRTRALREYSFCFENIGQELIWFAEKPCINTGIARSQSIDFLLSLSRWSGVVHESRVAICCRKAMLGLSIDYARSQW